MFGGWIWSSISRTGGWEFEEGRSLSHATVIRIIAAPQRREPLAPVYLHRFYVSLVNGLNKGDIGVVTSIIANLASRGLWDVLKGEDGARAIVPDLLLGLSRVIPEVSLGVCLFYDGFSYLLLLALQLSPSFTRAPPIHLDELRHACFQLMGNLYAFLTEFSDVLLDRLPDQEGPSPPPLPPRHWEKIVAGGGIRPQIIPSQTSMEFGFRVRNATTTLRQWYEAQQRGLPGVIKGVYGRSYMAKLELDTTKGFHDLPATLGLVNMGVGKV